jgi:cytoskeletal protein CcmA (bactofilin family)
MFGGKKEGNSSGSSTSGSSSGTNIIIEGTEIRGNINAQSDIRIDGKLEGNLNCSSRLLLGKSGKVVGDIKSKKAVLEGSIDGNIHVQSLLHVKDSANVEGDIFTDQLIVEAGATINGNCNMGSGANAKKSNLAQQRAERKRKNVSKENPQVG